MDTLTTSASTQTFRRLKLLRMYPLAIAAAAIMLFIFPLSSGIIIAVLVLLVGFNIFMIPYWSDKITFSSDGYLTWGTRKAPVQPAQITRCTYSTVITALKAPKWHCIALYVKSEGGLNPPAVVIPIHGWLAKDRQLLFQTLNTWLANANIEIDAKTEQIINNLAVG